MDTKWIDFQKHGDDRGNLVVAEYEKEIPFLVKRIYYIYGVDDDKHRGFHAHRELVQILVAVAGKCKMLLDDGTEKTVVELNSPSKGIVVAPGVWHEMYDFDENTVLMSLASDVYKEQDYIRNYDDFLNYIRSKNK